MPGQSTYTPFRRRTDPLMVPVGVAEGSNFTVPEGYIMPGVYNAFCVVNSNPCWVRLKGFKMADSGLVEEGKGWLFPPGHIGVYATQLPERMSALAVVRAGFPVNENELAPLEVSYGDGN